MSYIDAIKTPTNAAVRLTLPQYTRWKAPLTDEQLESWTHLALNPTKSIDQSLDLSYGMPIITSWTDQRSKGVQKVRRYQAKHLAAGLCVACPNTAGPTSTRLCDKCHARKMLWQKNNRGR